MPVSAEACDPGDTKTQEDTYKNYSVLDYTSGPIGGFS